MSLLKKNHIIQEIRKDIKNLFSSFQNSIQYLFNMSALIQGCKIQSNVSSIDFNNGCTHFATGGRQCIKIFELRLHDDCWFQCKKTIGKYKGTNITKTCVSQMAWNKQGADIIAIGTTSGYVLAYEASNPYKNIMQIKGHDGNINNIEWNPGSRANFVSSSFENYIIQWDIRESDRFIAKYNFSENTKIRDIKFSPHNHHYLAVQSSTKLQITDVRKDGAVVAVHGIHDNQLQGIGVQWDPLNPQQIASAISKEINIFNISSQQLQVRETLSHYSLIKSFLWMKSKENHFGILGEHPEKNIFFYDMEEKNRIAYMYGGHGRSIDCWRMDVNETILLSASNIKNTRNASSSSTGTCALLVAQHTDNYFDPNDTKFNYPITFDNDNNIAFCLNLQDPPAKRSFTQITRKKSMKSKQTAPLYYKLLDNIEWSQINKMQSIKQEVVFLHQSYIIQGKNEEISENNSFISRQIGKHNCSQIWKSLFVLAFPLQQQYHTIDSIFEEKLQLDISVMQGIVTLYNKDQIIKTTRKIEVCEILQWLVDQNQLQTAVLAAICLMNKQADLIDSWFFNKIFTPYIQILRNFSLYCIAAETISLIKQQKFTANTEKDTSYNITCGWCKESVSKKNCKCDLHCVLCEKKLNKRMVIWCKYCGHGGHVIEYQQWFKEDKKELCPHGCGHACFTADDF